MPAYLDTFIVAFIGGIASGVTGLIGILFTQRYTDNRKLVDATLRELEKLTDDCSGTAGRAWENSGNPVSADTAETICLLHDIASYTDFITTRVPTAGLRINPALINFRRSTSGDDFDVLNRAPNLNRKSEIRSSAAALKMAFRGVIYERNRIGIPFFAGD